MAGGISPLTPRLRLPLSPGSGTDPATDGNDRVDINAGGAEQWRHHPCRMWRIPAVGWSTTAQPTDTKPVCRSQGKTIITGRGGLPPSPNEALDSEAIQVDWVT